MIRIGIDVDGGNTDAVVMEGTLVVAVAIPFATQWRTVAGLASAGPHYVGSKPFKPAS